MASKGAPNVSRFAGGPTVRCSLSSSLWYTMPKHYEDRNDSDAGDSDEELFAELEAEIENDENAAVRERGMEQLKKE